MHGRAMSSIVLYKMKIKWMYTITLDLPALGVVVLYPLEYTDGNSS